MNDLDFLRCLSLNTADTIHITRDPVIATKYDVEETDLFLKLTDNDGRYIHLVLLPQDMFLIIKQGESFTITQLLESYEDMITNGKGVIE